MLKGKNTAKAKLTLEPSGTVLEVDIGSSLRDSLREQDLEFPCGGRGTCRGCLIKVTSGETIVNDAQEAILDPSEINEGWRLGCQVKITDDLCISWPSWDMQILSDSNAKTAESQDVGLGVAIDVGTTTIAAQLVERSSLELLDTAIAPNTQARFGSDVMSRLDHTLRSEEGSGELASLIRAQTQKLIRSIIPIGRDPDLTKVILVGNTAMHHFFGNLPATSLAHFPFTPASLDPLSMSVADLGWNLARDAEISFLPNLGGFVGSDILAGILATDMHKSINPVGFIDLGTNCEMVVGNRDGLLCASAAAGPAFEGARIEMGLSAVSGAISEVYLENAEIKVNVIGGAQPRGICGSGLVDAVALGLNLGIIEEDGRLNPGDKWEFAKPVSLSQRDIREVQLAKGAISAGFRMLLNEAGFMIDELQAVYLGGAFGNYIHTTEAQRLGLFECSADQITPIGNSALRGAKLALQDHNMGDIQSIKDIISHVELATLPGFQDNFADAMFFKDSARS